MGLPQYAVRIARPDQGQLHIPRCGEHATVPGGFTRLERADLQDVGFEDGDGAEPGVRDLKWTAAIKADAGADNVEPVVRTQIGPG